mmetsp:Transcript_12434/g.31471  ORF Transcript_12434/g.31471 Transcript_12434/m.31471 type:complete len:208 (-) Transcript_12434:213-836(-)
MRAVHEVVREDVDVPLEADWPHHAHVVPAAKRLDGLARPAAPLQLRVVVDAVEEVRAVLRRGGHHVVEDGPRLAHRVVEAQQQHGRVDAARAERADHVLGAPGDDEARGGGRVEKLVAHVVRDVDPVLEAHLRRAHEGGQHQPEERQLLHRAHREGARRARNADGHHERCRRVRTLPQPRAPRGEGLSQRALELRDVFDLVPPPCRQ